MYLSRGVWRLSMVLMVGTLIFFSFFTLAASEDLTEVQRKTCDFFGVQSTICRPADIAILHGGCEFNPYPILEERYKASRNVQITPRVDSDSPSLRQGISPSLACRLVKFFQYAEKERGCRLSIISAYRSAQQQADMCGNGRAGCAAAGRSCHQYGLAVDIGGSDSCVAWARSVLGDVKKNSRAGAQEFKLHFPYSGDHIQCAENAAAACNPGTRQCDGSSRIIPELAHSAPSPSAAFSESLRQWFSPPQATPAQPAIPSQPVQQSQNPLNAFNESTSTGEFGGVSSQLNTGTMSTGSSTAADRLEELAFGPKPATSTTSTATSVPLVVSGSNAAVLTGTQQASTTAVIPTQGVISPSQTTFTSGDLSWQDGTVSSAPVSGVQAILITIRSALTRMLQYLVPFSARGDLQLEGHDHSEPVE